MSSSLSHHAAQQILQNRWPWDPQGTRLPELFHNDIFLDHLFVKGSDAYSCRKRLLDFAGIPGDPGKIASLREALECLFQQPEARARFHWGSTFGDGERGFLALLRDSFKRSWNRNSLIGVNLSHPPEARVKIQETAKDPKASKDDKPKLVAASAPKPYGPRDLAELGHAHLILLLECPLADTHWTLCKSLAEHPEVQSLLYPDPTLLDACRRDFDGIHLTCRDVLLSLGHGHGKRKSFIELRQKELNEFRQLLLDSDSLLEKRKAALVAVVQRLAQDLVAMQVEIDRIKTSSSPQDWLSQARQLLPGIELAPEARALLPHIDKTLGALADELAAIEQSREKALELAPLTNLTAQLKSSLAEELLSDLKEYLDRSLASGAQPQLYLLPDSDIYKRFEWLQKLLKNREMEELPPSSAGDFTHALASAIRFGVVTHKVKKDPDSSAKDAPRDWENRVQEQKEQIGDLLSQLIRKSREIEDLEARLDKLENAATGAQQKESLPPTPRKPLDCVQLAQDQFPGELLFLDSARESAAASPYGNTEELWKHFEVMSQLARIWQQKQGSLGDSFYNVFKRLGLADYKGHLSDTSASRFRDQYTFTWDGASHLFEEHFTLGSKDANTCLSIHFLRDEVKQRFVVAHVGRHRANTCS